MEQIISASGIQYGLIVTSGGAINVNNYSLIPSTDFNPVTRFVYSGTAIGSMYKLTTTGSYLKVFTYDGSDNLTTIGSWLVV